ncbi:MAG: molybdate ABC transporter substrate-binding protein [Geminicoccaceae bacterium]
MRRFIFTMLLLGLTLPNLRTGPARADQPFIVAAASSLHHALEELADAFSASGHTRPRLVFGSSGNISEQIARDAPFELFLAADELHVLTLFEQDVVDGPGEIYAFGRLALFAATGSPVEVDANLDGLAGALESGALNKLAIANPEIAPYGAAAMQALSERGILEKAERALVFGENVAQASQFAISGAADAGLIALSIAMSLGMEARGTWVAVDPSLSHPLHQRMVLTRKAGDEARDFFAFILGDEARAILEHHGFGLPDPSGSD